MANDGGDIAEQTALLAVWILLGALVIWTHINLSIRLMRRSSLGWLRWFAWFPPLSAWLAWRTREYWRGALWLGLILLYLALRFVDVGVALVR